MPVTALGDVHVIALGDGDDRPTDDVPDEFHRLLDDRVMETTAEQDRTAASDPGERERGEYGALADPLHPDAEKVPAEHRRPSPT